VWLLNNAALTWGALRLLNTAPAAPHRRPLLLKQGLFWLDYVSFGPVFFGLRSPILGTAWTWLGFGLTGSSLRRARRVDPPLARAYWPVTLWTGFAGTVSLYLALRNRDRFFGTPAPLSRPPVAALEKRG
jgi:tryptophan-rich sensory protein